MEAVRIISLDPGYDRCGIAVIEKPRIGNESLLFSDCLTTSKELPFATRLSELAAQVEATIAEYHPQYAALERLYFNKNQKTAMMVSEVRGMLLYILDGSGLHIFEYTPQQIKVAVTGNGRSDKKAVMSMVPKLIRLERKVQHDDEFDAIAAGLCCAASERLVFGTSLH
jgi:crossover junction endodeoxyribonuclease RuvC